MQEFRLECRSLSAASCCGVGTCTGGATEVDADADATPPERKNMNHMFF